MPKRNAPESIVFTVRLPKEDRDWLVSIAERFGVDAATVIRWAIDALRRYIDANGGRVHLPIDFREIWKEIEHRAPAAVSESPSAEPPARKRARA